MRIADTCFCVPDFPVNGFGTALGGESKHLKQYIRKKKVMSKFDLSKCCRVAFFAIGFTLFQAHSVLAVDPSPPPGGPPAPVLSSIAVSGPVVVDEKSSVQYACMATYSDGSVSSVDAVWSQNSANASIDAAGLLTVGDVDSDESALIAVSYGGKTATLGITILDLSPTLDSITISGP